jgi:antitoxin component YwqK of YwqJK toxin-antitoxin module
MKNLNKRIKIIDGFEIKYHANGKTIWSKGKTINGVPEGYWEWFRVDGTLKRSGYFAKGKQTGLWTTYDSKGKPYKVTKL